MTDVDHLHHEAMELAEAAQVQRLRGDSSKALALARRAFDKERQAAHLTTERTDFEPTRSVLHRSAAALALDCGETREAERLVSAALVGNPPAEIADELRDILEQVSFQRHLDLRGIELSPQEVQFSITGNAVGFGVAESDAFVSRVQDLERLIHRTAERRAQRTFRERGKPAGVVARLELFLSTPRAASFAVSLKIGETKQTELPGISLAEVVVDELLDCLELFNSADKKALQARIPDEAYLRNFVGLARKLAPDGVSVRAVGFTAKRGDRERRVLVTRTQEETTSIVSPELQRIPAQDVKVQGFLKFADDMKGGEGEIRLLDSKGKVHPVKVPPGMMDDIVRPLWDFEVEVAGTRQGQVLLLEHIKKKTN